VGGTQGFKVDPDALLAVAQQIDDLHSTIAEGNTAGNLPNFQKNGGAEPLKKALGVFWAGGGDDPLAAAYDTEHNAIVTTYNTIATQLQTLASTCRTTAQNYRDQDHQSSQQVKQSSADAPWSPT